MVFIRVGEVLTNRRHVFTSSKRVIDALLVLSAWEQIIKDINCVEKFKRTKAASFKNGRLTITVASNTIFGELKMCEGKILAAYAKYFKAEIVKELIVRRN